MSRTSSTKGLKKPSPAGLARAGVKFVQLVLECHHCRAQGSPKVTIYGRLPPRYWQCPNRCHVQQ
jgi:hypothetical protein